MMLLMLILMPFVFGFLVFISPAKTGFSKALSVGGLLVSFAIFLVIGREIFDLPVQNNGWLLEWKMPWIPSFNINFHLGLDGLSFWFVLLALVMGILAVLCSKQETSPNLFYAAILWAIGGALGIFMAADVFLFFIFWEVALFPLYLILIVFGSAERMKASLRYIFYTQASGLFLLLSIIGLAYAHLEATGRPTFDYQELLLAKFSENTQFYLFIGLMLAFLIKLPAFPLHGWIQSFFVSAPTSLILVGILIKLGVFGLLRFSWPLLPNACATYSPVMMALGAFTMLYGAIIAFVKAEPKALLAYSTFSHAGFLLMGVFCPIQAAFFGVLFLTICQALSTGGVLLLIDRLQARYKTPLNLNNTGGLWHKGPQFAVILLAFLLAGMGLPIFGNFVGEWLILWATFLEHIWIAVLASLGILAGAVYSLWVFQRLCFGIVKEDRGSPVLKLEKSEVIAFFCIIATLVVLGLYPTLVSKPSSQRFSTFKSAQKTTNSIFVSNKALHHDSHHSK